ncbi:MAG: ABC transporter ATP-binding protein, partial [Bdellovibrionales bacterium]
HLIPYLTALENVELPLRLLGENNSAARSIVLLTALGLKDRTTHLSSQLSGGECQRVAVARALVHSPRLLLADEPTGSLDHKAGQVLLDLIMDQFRQRSQTAIIVTHSLEVAGRCDRVFRLAEGRLWSHSSSS